MRRAVALGVAIAMGIAGCSSEDTESNSSEAPRPPAPASSVAEATTSAPTTAAPVETGSSAGLEADPVSFQGPGPHEVGVTTLELPTGNLVEVFYPADDSAAGETDSYQVRSFLPPVLEDIIPTETADSYEIEASRDHAASADGPFPLVLFSHGAASFRSQSTELSRHLASWGMVVASTDHPTRNLESQLSNTETGAQSSADDVRAARTLVTTIESGPIAGLVDPSRVAVSGHSAGGGTALQVASDDGVAGYISYASGSGDSPLPDLPSLFMAGASDGIVAPQATSDAHRAAPGPSWLWVIGRAGHLAFSDLCAIGAGRGGLIGLAESAGIGDLVPDELRRLATDGCEPPNHPVADVWPAINQASVAFYRLVFGLEDDTEGRGLDSIELDGVDVTIEVRPAA